MSHQEHRGDTDNKRLRANSPSAHASVAFTENTKQWFSAVIMSLSITTNVVIGIALYQKHRESLVSSELYRYDLDNFKQTEWADLKAQVSTQHELIQAYGLQKAVKDAAREK